MLAWTFSNEEIAQAWWGRVRAKYPTLKAGPDDYAQIHRCYHDEDENKPCEIIEEL